MINKIKQLKLKKFRGATDETIIDFDCHKQLFIIFGENGTGKTTILDAIDFACNKNNEVSLKHKSIGTNKYKYIASFSSQLSNLEVTIETTLNNTYKAKFANKGDINVEAGLPSVEVLRRDSILKIVTGQPKERFDEIRNMVSYSKIKKMEDALRECQKVINKIYEDAIKSYNQEETNLKNTWQQVGDLSIDCLEWAKKRAVINKNDLEKEKNIWQTKLKKIEVLKDGEENITQLGVKLEKIKNDLEQKNNTLQEKLNSEVKKEGLVSLLEKAKAYIESQTMISACPICNNKVDKNTLLAEISSRIDQMKDLKKIQDEVNFLTNEKTALEKQINNKKQNSDKILGEINALFNAEESLKLNDTNDILSKSDKWTEIATEKEKEYNQLDLINLSYNTYMEKKEEAEKSEKKSKKIQNLLQELEVIRKETVDAILNDISSTVERMYAAVHPDEGLGSIKFYLDPKKSESLEFDGSFLGDTVSPQAYYSESHLDSLGICVFLALSQYNRNDGIILLDDVLTSVDHQHMNRLINMLEKEANNFGQIIITTHYRPWRDRYRMPIQQNNNVELIELLPWTTNTGVRHSQTKFYLDEIRGLLVEIPFNRQEVASKAGILLEHLLDEIILKYALKVPRRPIQKYTLNELFNSIDSKMRKLLNVVDCSNKPFCLQQTLDNIQNTIFIRNEVGCHYSEVGALLVDDEVRDFGNQVVIFADLLLCNTCGAFPNKNKTGSYWECCCGNLKLNPLQKPKL